MSAQPPRRENILVRELNNLLMTPYMVIPEMWKDMQGSYAHVSRKASRPRQKRIYKEGINPAVS